MAGRHQDREFVEGTAEFVDHSELVFDNDGDMTRGVLDETKHFIDPHATFLEPRVDDESYNWAPRRALLASYRRRKPLVGARRASKPLLEP